MPSASGKVVAVEEWSLPTTWTFEPKTVNDDDNGMKTLDISSSSTQLFGWNDTTMILRRVLLSSLFH